MAGEGAPQENDHKSSNSAVATVQTGLFGLGLLFAIHLLTADSKMLPRRTRKPALLQAPSQMKIRPIAHRPFPETRILKRSALGPTQATHRLLRIVENETLVGGAGGLRSSRVKSTLTCYLLDRLTCCDETRLLGNRNLTCQMCLLI